MNEHTIMAIGTQSPTGMSEEYMKSCTKCSKATYLSGEYDWKEVEPICVGCFLGFKIKDVRMAVKNSTIKGLARRYNIPEQKARELCEALANKLDDARKENAGSND